MLIFSTPRIHEIYWDAPLKGDNLIQFYWIVGWTTTAKGGGIVAIVVKMTAFEWIFKTNKKNRNITRGTGVENKAKQQFAWCWWASFKWWPRLNNRMGRRLSSLVQFIWLTDRGDELKWMYAGQFQFSPARQKWRLARRQWLTTFVFQELIIWSTLAYSSALPTTTRTRKRQPQDKRKSSSSNNNNYNIHKNQWVSIIKLIGCSIVFAPDPIVVLVLNVLMLYHMKGFTWPIVSLSWELESRQVNEM